MTSTWIASFVEAVRGVAGSRAALHEPVFCGRELDYVTDCIKSGWVSSVGAYVDRLEAEIGECAGAHAVATVNGTAALHVALKLAGVSTGDEVIIPALSFVATANAVAYCGAVPHFADVCGANLGLCPKALATHLASIAESFDGGWRNKLTKRRIAAVVPMHTFGHPCAIDELVSLANEYTLPVIEDAAESLGSYFRGQHTGTFGLLGVLSFNGNKIVTSGGGGIILTKDSNLAKRAKHITTTAKLPHRWRYFHDMVGYNYRMPNINAALACAQLEQLPTFLKAKRAIAHAYADAFGKLGGAAVLLEPKDAQSNYWLNTVRLLGDKASLLEQVLEATNATGLMTRPCWEPLNELPMYQASPAADLSNTRELVRSLLNLPSGAGLAGGMLNA